MELKKERNSSFELLRLILMVMIVAHHCIVHGLALSGIGAEWAKLSVAIQTEDMPLFMTANAFFVCAVNVFVLISGYFSIRLSWSKVSRLLFLILFYSVVASTAYYFLVDHKITTFVKGFMILSKSPYWFLKNYLILMAFAPMINNFFRDYSKRETGSFTLVLLFVSCYLGFQFGNKANVDGYTFFQFLTMYCIGRYIRINDIKLAWRKSIPLYIGFSLMIGIAMYYLYMHGSGKAAWKISYYNDPFVILAAISLFLAFQSFTFSSKWINKCSASSLSVYLVQSSVVVEYFLYPLVRQMYISNNNTQFRGG
jgi:surface polysaccharide O-acyltransferase-like enzyme